MTISELYEEIGGNLEDLMTRIPKEEMIKKFVCMYAASELHEDMLKAYADKDYQKLFEVTHGLKGMSANISLDATTEIISLICESVRNGQPTEDISRLVEKADEQQKKLVALVAELDCPHGLGHSE